MSALTTQQPIQSRNLQSNNQEKAGQSYQPNKVQTEQHNLDSEIQKFYSDSQEAGQSQQPYKVQTVQNNLDSESQILQSNNQEKAGQSYQPNKIQTEQHNFDSEIYKFYSDSQEAGQSQQPHKVQTQQNNLDSESQILQNNHQVESRVEQSQQQVQSTQFSEIQNEQNQEKNESLNIQCNKFQNQEENLHIFLENLVDGDNFETYSLSQELIQSQQELSLLIFINKNVQNIKLQMSIIEEGNQLQQISVQDYIMTLPNICLCRNKDLNLGSFYYSHQNSQIIYQASISKKGQKINQLGIIIEKVMNNFTIIIKQILKFQFKLEGSYYSVTKSKHIKGSTDDFSEQLIMDNFSKDERQIILKKQEENEQEITQTYQTIQQENDNKPTFRKSKRLNAISQIITLQNDNYYEYKVLEQIKNTENNLIDQGGFHKIYKIRLDIGTGKEQEYAVKTQQNEKLQKEIQFIKNYLQNSYSKYIVQVFVINSKTNVFYLLEYCYFKSLRDYQKKYSLVITLNTKMRILRQIAKGILHLHDRKIFHLDIKPDNILIDLEGNAKICDFGEAFHPNYQSQRDCIKYSIPYSAPELLKHKTRFLSAKADVFSFGILASELCFGKLPIYFSKKDQYLKRYSDKNQEFEDEVDNLKDGPRQIISKLRSLIQKCTNYDIKARPDIRSIMKYLKCLKILYEVEQLEFNTQIQF